MTIYTKPKNTVLSRRLRQARLNFDLPQDKLGVLAGLEESSSSARMSRYESGVHEPNYQFIESVGRVLGISEAFFYCSDDRLAEIIQLYSISSEEKREKLHQMAEKILK